MNAAEINDAKCEGLGSRPARFASRCVRSLRSSSASLRQPQQGPSQLEDVDQRAGDIQSLGVLGDTPVAHFSEAKDSFQDQEGMLHPGAHQRLVPVLAPLNDINSIDVFGNVTQETYGNNIVTTRTFDPKSGRLTAIDSVLGSTKIQENDYTWRSNGILESRFSKQGTALRQETFGYDAHNRLTSAVTVINSSTVRTMSNAYDALGNIEEQLTDASADPDITNYDYGAGSAGPNAVTSVDIGGVTNTLTYDLNGAIVKYDIDNTSIDKYIKYNATNQPTKIVVGTSLTDSNPQARDEFRYDTDGNRVHKRSVWKEGGNTLQEDTYYVGGYEATYYTNDPSMYAVLKTRVGENIMHVVAVDNSFNIVNEVEYAHRDHLGSIEKVTNQPGMVLRSMAFEPFGGRKSTGWQSNITSGELSSLLEQWFIPDYYYPGLHLAVPREARGFTGHEHLDRTGFIHMNGRVYDPVIGRFLSPDPIVQEPTNSQSWNRYSYAFNSPLSYVDPSGYCSVIYLNADGSVSYVWENGCEDFLDGILPGPGTDYTDHDICAQIPGFCGGPYIPYFPNPSGPDVPLPPQAPLSPEEQAALDAWAEATLGSHKTQGNQQQGESYFEHLPGFLSEVAVGFGDGVYKGITFGMGDLDDVRGLFGIEYEPSDGIVYDGAHTIGAIHGGATLAGSAAVGAFSRGGWLNTGGNLRIGVGKHEGFKVFRIAGDWINTASRHIDLFKMGKWP